MSTLGQHAHLVRSLVVRNLTVKYQGSALGFLWTLLNPFLTVMVLVAVFGFVVRIQIDHYWAFLISGYFVWNFTQLTLNTATQVIADHGQLCRSLAFPSEVLVMAAVGSRFVEFLLELLPVTLVLVILHHRGVPASFAMIVPLVILVCATLLGLAFPLATVSVFHRDIQHGLPVALTILFYLSPVFYPASMIPETLRPFYFLNPMAGLLTLFHRVLYEGRFPGWVEMVVGFAVATVFLIVGYGIFKRNKRVFPEVV